MRRHAESDYLALLAEVLEGERVIAFIAINNKKLVYVYCTALRIGVKILQLIYF